MTREEAIKIVRNIYQTDAEKEALGTLIPELAESEDERIRKEIVDYFKKECECLLNDFRDKEDEKQLSFYNKALAWLEKQKEHQNRTDAPKEKSVGGDFLSSHKDKNLDEIAQDYVDGVKEYNPEPTWDLMQTAVCYGYHYREQEEQKPVKHPKMVEMLREHLENTPKEQLDVEFEELKNWDDVGPTVEEFFHGKPIEWNEKDEKMRACAISLLQISRDSGMAINPGFGKPVRAINKCIDWLESLRPQPKQDKGPIAKFVQAVEDAEQYRKGYEEGLRDGMKRHWKPSEEQMEALRLTIDFMPDTFKPRCTLITLQNGLEKLI